MYGLMFYYDFLPGVAFTPFWQLDWTMTEQLLGSPEETRVPNPDDYETHVVEFDLPGPPTYALAFVPMNRRIDYERRYVLSRDALFLRSDRGLLVVELEALDAECRTDGSNRSTADAVGSETINRRDQ